MGVFLDSLIAGQNARNQSRVEGKGFIETVLRGAVAGEKVRRGIKEKKPKRKPVSIRNSAAPKQTPKPKPKPVSIRNKAGVPRSKPESKPVPVSNSLPLGGLGLAAAAGVAAAGAASRPTPKPKAKKPEQKPTRGISAKDNRKVAEPVKKPGQKLTRGISAKDNRKIVESVKKPKKKPQPKRGIETDSSPVIEEAPVRDIQVPVAGSQPVVEEAIRQNLIAGNIPQEALLEALAASGLGESPVTQQALTKNDAAVLAELLGPSVRPDAVELLQKKRLAPRTGVFDEQLNPQAQFRQIDIPARQERFTRRKRGV